MKAKQTETKDRNWPLIIGGTLMFLIMLLTFLGPFVAPWNPSDRTLITQIDGRYQPPPFPPFRLWEHPLGTDAAGRDLLSRLLWGLQPTLALVTFITLLRLLFGVVIGLMAGWSQETIGRIARSSTTFALSLPMLIVALALIALVGVERGLFAFAVALTVTGWAEIARVVSEQTRIVAAQKYIEAARALGASDVDLLRRHVLRHLKPLFGMLFAFEFGAVLLLTGTLGFLGYYIGGGITIQLDDRVFRTFAQMPELGQMLADSFEQSMQPGPLVVVGSVVFLIILGCNLLGEGLRRETNRGIWQTATQTAAQHTSRRQRMVGQLARLAPATAAFGLVVLTLSALTRFASDGQQLAQRTPAPVLPTSVPATPVPVAQKPRWANEGYDSSGTRLISQPIGTATPETSWKFEDRDGFTGGPAIAADGTIYLSTASGKVYALDISGTERWQIALPHPAVGTPAIGVNGDIYVSDDKGGLNAIAPDSTIRWRFQSESGRQATSGPLVGPDGVIYYTLIDRVQAVTPAGASRWLSPEIEGYYEVPPFLDVDKQMVLLPMGAFNVADGSPIAFDNGVKVDRFTEGGLFAGADGRNYYRVSASLTSWRQVNGEIEAGGMIEDIANTRRVLDVGVLPNGQVWSFCEVDWEVRAMCWAKATDPTNPEVLRSPNIQVGYDSKAQMIAIDPQSKAVVCAGRTQVRISCQALAPELNEPVWEIELEGVDGYRGGALTDDYLYVATGNSFFALQRK
jgi:peptide/nickel transport system permease protein